jgi:hypothetical protein
VSPYYKGVVVYKGVEYQGIHAPLVDGETWQKVQDVLNSHLNGERTREHPHFLKGSLYCKNCGSRMIITYSKSRSGVVYPYYICSGRHSKRIKDCDCKAILIEEIERQVEQIYEQYSLEPNARMLLETALTEEINKACRQFETEKVALRKEKEKLERKQKKLLEAHYNDAIRLDLLKSEQAQITAALASIGHQLKAYDTQSEAITVNLKKVLDLVEDCGRTYKLADEHIKRIFNQALCDKIWVESNGRVSAELAEPFKCVIEPVRDDLAKYNVTKADGLPGLPDFLEKITNHIQYFFGYGLNKVQIVETRGLEPMTSRV